MAKLAIKDVDPIPYGRLGLISLESSKELGEKVDQWLVSWRGERKEDNEDLRSHEGYHRDSYLISVTNPRFGSGEGNVSSTNPSVAMMSISFWMSATTVSPIPWENIPI